MERFLNDKQKQEINDTLEELGEEYGLSLNSFDNILLASDPMKIIYNHEVIGLCSAEVNTEYFENGEIDALRECMRDAIIKLKEQLDQADKS